MTEQDLEKRVAATHAVRLVEDGMRLGLGSGSTALLAVAMLGERVQKGLDVVGVPTSRETAHAAREAGIPLDHLRDDPHLDLTIDGADETDAALRLIKGGGGALLREKIVAQASDRMIVVVDGSKVVVTLGAFPLPVEVIPFADAVVAKAIRDLGVEPTLRKQKGSDDLFVTDEMNHILDCPFEQIDDPEGLAAALASIPGVVEHGLFLGLATEVVIARGETRPQRSMARLPPEIQITNRVRIPEAEVELSYARSGGPGGQHVNKTATKVQLRWNALASEALNEEDRRLLSKRLESRLTKDGELVVSSERYRDQGRNVEDAIEHFQEIVRKAIERPKPRKKTRPTKASKERRLADKRRRSEKKRDRRDY